MQTVTTTQVLSLFDNDKAGRLHFVQDIIQKIDNGEADALKIHLQAKQMEEIVKTLTSNETYRSFLLDAAQKHGKSFELHNAKFQVKEAGTKYDYRQCGHPQLNELELQLEVLAKQIKAIQAQLQTLPIEGVEQLFGDEVVRIYPPSKVSSTTVAVTLK